MPDNENDPSDISDKLAKAPTGIHGLDEILKGGLPKERMTLACGGPGCGKTVLSMEFLINGAEQFGEPGLFVSFEESPLQLYRNFLSFGYDIERLVEHKKLYISHIDFSGGEIIDAGDFTLDGLFIRIEQGIKKVGAKRIALDTMETLFSAFPNKERLRIEVARLFHWLREKGMTTIVTGEKGDTTMTRWGFEEYVSDCVLTMDHRIKDQISKRRLRVVKYRGSSHGADEHPFLIERTGISVLPITSVHLEHKAGTERIPSGIADIDKMLGGAGYFRGSTVLVAGRSGSGKSSIAAAFAESVCKGGERCLYLTFEESPAQLVRNMESIGIKLAPWIEKKRLFIDAARPTVFGLEEHLVSIFLQVKTLKPDCVVMDPVSNFMNIGTAEEIKSMLIRLMDQMKNLGITVLLINLVDGSGTVDETETAISSLVDTWIALNYKLYKNFRHRELMIIKSRGMDHSMEVREFKVSSDGLSLGDLPYVSLEKQL